MKQIFFILLFFYFGGCKQAEKQYDVKSFEVANYLSSEKQDSFKYSIIRYTGQLPPKANHNTKFESRFDDYYQQLANEHILLYYFPKKEDSYVYFLLTRRAPSLHDKKVGIGGKLKYSSNGDILEYEEVFRTWKMDAGDQEVKFPLLFSKFVNGENLEPYLTKNSKGIEYIEFPDDLVFFDKEKRVWVTKDLQE